MNSCLPVWPHDLLWGLAVADVPADAPAWVTKVVGAGQPVVVRRAKVAEGWVAVGVRGHSRDQRYATAMRLTDITRRVRPEELVEAVDSHAADWPALRALRHIRPVMDAVGLPWGVAGSVGFELASGAAVLHQDSDLDLVLRTSTFFSREQAVALVDALGGAVCRIDLQLQTPAGAVALREWAGSARQVLLKANDAARLVTDPWLPEACAA
jgi:phosphoribosyl-dephospho-CoA transferase